MENEPIKKNYYFTATEQQACIDYNNTTDTVEKERIYNTHIHSALMKIAECVTNRFRFEYILAEMGLNNLVQSAAAHIATIIPQFNAERGKAYSFFSFCCKNYLIQENEKAYKRSKTDISLNSSQKNPSGEDYMQTQPESLTYEDEIHKRLNYTEYMKLAADYWETRGKDLFKKKRQKFILKHLIDIMRDPSCIEYPPTGGRKVFYSELRNRTGFRTPVVSLFMQQIRPIHNQLLKEYITTGDVKGKGVKLGIWEWKNKAYRIP